MASSQGSSPKWRPAMDPPREELRSEYGENRRPKYGLRSLDSSDSLFDEVAPTKTLSNKVKGPKDSSEFSHHRREREAPPVPWGWQFVFRKNDRCRALWNFVCAIMLVYMATIFLYRFCFFSFHIGPDGQDPLGTTDVGWNAINYTVDGLFWFDLVFSFFLSFEDDTGLEVIALDRIFWRYMRLLFWINLLACLPESAVRAFIEAVSEKDSGVGNVSDFGIARVYRLQRISRLARLVRLTRLVKLVKFEIHSAYWDWFKTRRSVRVINFLVGLLWACHFLACGWYLCAALHDDVTYTWVGRRTVISGGEEKTLLHQSPFEQWLVSMYFVLTVFTTVGFGDISAGTEGEIFYVVFTMICGAVVNSIIISEVITVVTSTDKKQEFVDRQLHVLDAFIEHVQLDPAIVKHLREEIHRKTRINYNAVTDTGFDKEDMKQLILGRYMPRHLLGTVPLGLFHGQLMHNKFMQCCTSVSVVPPRLPMLLAINLHPADFYPGEIVYQMHDFAYNIYLVQAGTFANIGLPNEAGGEDCMVQDWVASAATEQEQMLESRRSQALSKMAYQKKASGTNSSLGKGFQSQTSTPMGGRSVAIAQAVSKPLTSARIAVSVTAGRMSSMLGTPSPDDLVLTKEESFLGSSLFPYRFYGKGSYFGEFECILGVGRLSTVVCEDNGTPGQALSLKKRDLSDLANEFPQFGEAWASAAWRREAMRTACLKTLTAKRSCRHAAAARIQQVFREYRLKPGRSKNAGECSLHSANNEGNVGDNDSEDSGEGIVVARRSSLRTSKGFNMVANRAHNIRTAHNLRSVTLDRGKQDSNMILREIESVNRRLDSLQEQLKQAIRPVTAIQTV